MGGEAIVTGLIVAIAVGWIGWISISTIQNQVKINKLSSLGEQFDDVKDDIKMVSDRLDLFLKNELDVLKKIAEKE